MTSGISSIDMLEVPRYAQDHFRERDLLIVSSRVWKAGRQNGL